MRCVCQAPEKVKLHQPGGHLAKANHGDCFGGSLTLVINVVPVQLEKPERIAKNPPQVVSKHLESGWHMFEGWKNQEHLGWYHLVLLHFARKEDAGPPAPASYGAGIVVGALRVAVQLPTELPKVEHWGRVAWVYGVARKERILNNR